MSVVSVFDIIKGDDSQLPHVAYQEEGKKITIDIVSKEEIQICLLEWEEHEGWVSKGNVLLTMIDYKLIIELIQGLRERIFGSNQGPTNS